MKRHLFLLSFFVVLFGCNGTKSNQWGDVMDSFHSEIDDSIHHVLHAFKKDDGSIRIFYQVKDTDFYKLWTKLTTEDDSLAQFISTPYDRDDDGEPYYTNGICEPFYYTVSPDKKNLYVVASIHACGSGWISEYQLFKIDCLTLEVRMIAECAAIKTTTAGFTVAQCRCTNKGIGVSSCDEIWVVHDEYLDWNGNITSVDTMEYRYSEMEHRYATPDKEYWYIKGFMLAE